MSLYTVTVVYGEDEATYIHIVASSLDKMLIALREELEGEYKISGIECDGSQVEVSVWQREFGGEPLIW